VTSRPEDYGFEGDLFHRVVARSTSVVVPYEWIHPDGSRRSVGSTNRAAVIER